MARVTIHAVVADDELVNFARLDELDLSLNARLSEVFDDDGNPITLHVTSVDLTLDRLSQKD